MSINHKINQTSNNYFLPSVFINNKEKFNNVILFIIVLYLLFNIKLNKNFILIFILLMIFILYYNNIKYNDTTEYQNISKIFDKLSINKKYKYLSINYDIINTYNKLSFLIRFNKTSYLESMYYMNKFYSVYYYIKIGLYKNFKQLDKLKVITYQKIQNIIMYRKEALNILKSAIFDSPIDDFIIDKQKVLNINKYISDNIKLLDIYSNNNLMELIKINNELMEDNINNNNNYIFINFPEPNPLNELNYMPNFNLY